jgi:hypothetical protein
MKEEEQGMDDSSDEKSQAPKVGYKSPPPDHQFRKGVSGNPKGRPRRSGSLAEAFAEVGQELVTITEGGRQRQVSSDEAAIRQLFAKAAQGIAAARRELIRRCHMTGAFTAWRKAQPRPGGVRLLTRELESPRAIEMFKKYQAERRARGEKDDPRRVPPFKLPDGARD